MIHLNLTRVLYSNFRILKKCYNVVIFLIKSEYSDLPIATVANHQVGAPTFKSRGAKLVKKIKPNNALKF